MFFWEFSRRLKYKIRRFGTFGTSETSAFILQMPGKFPKEHRLHSKHGESLKTTIATIFVYIINRSVIIMDTDCTFFEFGADFLYVICTNSSFKSVDVVSVLFTADCRTATTGVLLERSAFPCVVTVWLLPHKQPYRCGNRVR